ncbi:hypothetical protein [Arthrobacter sp. CJ23]|uniref:hypothetical protein n=1 Tax=Arthrobacter sp. CJ23 TaxID=2972479 RepID=UPI00215C2AC8|nr:hypothetical protein [Arthrobacter sp. CJ23]UVJ40375.1 hypothetical protein NVV90_04125 [Arthrobacter sp. CJ23]
MKTHQFQSERSDALRKQLVEMPSQLQPRKPHPSRRVLLAIGAASVGAIVLSGVPKSADPATNRGSNQQLRPAETAVPHDAYASIPSDEIQHVGTGADFFGAARDDFLWDMKDPYYGYDRAPIVARVHIDSIDGGRVFSPIYEQYVSPQTIGKMTVREVYKGDLAAGGHVNYSRGGGIITFEEFWNSRTQQQKDKGLATNGGQRPIGPKYVQMKLMDDIDIEAGKEYVVLLSPRSSKDGTFHEYFIDGMQFGLREVKGSGADTIVLNNVTKTWESLGSLVRLP